MERMDRMEGQLAGGAAEAQGARRASEAFAARGAALGDSAGPEVLAKAKRKQFQAEYKRRTLREADAARDTGGIGALPWREGLYSSLLNTWGRQREQGELAGLTHKRRGRKQKTVNPLFRLSHGGPYSRRRGHFFGRFKILIPTRTARVRSNQDRL